MTEQNFSFETVACLIAVLESNNVVLGQRHYDLMARLDGNRTGCGFQHQFRKVKARAKELQGELGDGKVASTPRKTKTPKKEATGTAPESKKRGKKKTADGIKPEDGQKDGSDAGACAGPTAGDTADTEAEETPSKKPKLEKQDMAEEQFGEFFSYQTGDNGLTT